MQLTVLLLCLFRSLKKGGETLPTYFVVQVCYPVNLCGIFMQIHLLLGKDFDEIFKY